MMTIRSPTPTAPAAPGPSRSWTAQTTQGTSAVVQVDAAGRVHIGYVDTAVGDLMYAYGYAARPAYLPMMAR